jgi:hypothetical protein
MRPHSTLVLALLVFTGSCVQTALSRETLRPIPEHPPRPDKPANLRGTAQAASLLSHADQAAIASEVIRVFYRPMMAQARWIDPRPLADQRTLHADSGMAPDHDRAIAIVEGTGLRRVCPLTEANVQCQGRDGGILRVSPAYAVGASGADSALVYVRYTPRNYGTASEIEFFLARRDSVWRIISRRSLSLDMPQGTTADAVVDTKTAAEELMGADRAYAAAASQTDLVTAISRMFLANVVVQAPGGHIRGRDSAVAAMRAATWNIGAKVAWTPIGGGTSSAGQDGFTYGYMTVTQADGVVQPLKYVAYWVKSSGGWRIAAYKRVPSRPGNVSAAPHPLSVATRALPIPDSTTIARYADELSLAEHEFSRDAQSMGLGPAFAKWGAPDAVNTGGAAHAEFVRGPQAIAASVSAGLAPNTTVEWAPTQVIVANTGDLGVSIGTIRITPAGGTARDVPFFTVWKRAWPSEPWRYIAE